MQNQEQNLINVYCDESRYTNPFEQYFLIGSLSCPRPQKMLIDKRLKQVRRKFGFMPELKWTNVTDTKIPYLNELLQVFFTSELEFRAIIIDKSKLALNSKQQPTELTFYKFYYLLLRGLMNPNEGYYVFVDERTKSDNRSLGELQKYLEGWLRQINTANGNVTSNIESNSAPTKYLRQIQEVKSEEVLMMQLLDLLMGAVGYYWNGFRGSPAKMKFVKNLTTRLQKGDLKFSSQLHDKKWNQFVWQPRESAN